MNHAGRGTRLATDGVMRAWCLLFATACGCRASDPSAWFRADATRGVLVVVATDFSSDEGTTREASWLCGEALRDAWPALRREFDQTIDGLPARCDGAGCVTPGWEFGPTTQYLLDGRVLTAVVRTGGTQSQRVLDEERDFVAAALAAGSTRRCLSR